MYVCQKAWKNSRVTVTTETFLVPRHRHLQNFVFAASPRHQVVYRQHTEGGLARRIQLSCHRHHVIWWHSLLQDWHPNISLNLSLMDDPSKWLCKTQRTPFFVARRKKAHPEFPLKKRLSPRFICFCSSFLNKSN